MVELAVSTAASLQQGPGLRVLVGGVACSPCFLQVLWFPPTVPKHAHLGRVETLNCPYMCKCESEWWWSYTLKVESE